MSKEDNIRIFEDTMNFCSYDKELSEAIIKQNQYTQIIPKEKDVDYSILTEGNSEKTKIVISKSKTFDAARKYTEGRTAVLNFASATTPGGGVTKGSSAQEESLCRCSTLYPTLTNERCWKEFYLPHRENLNPLHNDDIIWIPDVIVFKDDDYKLLDRKDWKKISVITCAAPNLREKNVDIFNVDKPLKKPISDKELFDIHYKRAMKIFAVAAKKQVKNLVIGAFGCGAFKNDPCVVAKAWKKAIENFNYQMIFEFAIYDSKYSNNYEIFKKVFEEKFSFENFCIF